LVSPIVVASVLFHAKDFHNFIAEMVDDFDGDAT
jgi:hypothetical protein